MTFLPIVQRELRVTARRRSTHWMRMAVASGAIITAATIYAAFSLLPQLMASPQQQVGEYIFKGLAVLSIVYCLVSGRLSTVDCLSEEKREGTLGLLFLTDLKGYDVVFGKLVATSLNSFYGLLAVFPVLAIPLLMGGITNAEFWRIVLVLVNTFLFSLAIGMFCSAISRDVSKAVGRNFALILLLTAGLPGCAGILYYFTRSNLMVPELCLSSPVFGLYLGFDAQYKLHPGYFWSSVAVIQVLTWQLLLLACWIVPFSWQDKATLSRPEKRGWRELWQAWSYGYGDPTKRHAFRKQLLDVNAFYWLAGRARLKPAHVWTFLGLLACWWIWGWKASGNLWLDEATYFMTAILLNSTLKLWITLEAGQRLAEDQKIGAMELLLSTPLTVRDILRGQLLALRRQFLKPLLVVIAIELFLMMQLLHFNLRSDPQILATWMAGIFMLVADSVALSWVSMRIALTAKSQQHAVITTVSRVLVLPWLIFGIVAGIANLWAGLWPTAEMMPSWKFYLGWWFGLGIFVDLAFGLMAWRQLQTSFRQLATHRFNPKPSRFAHRNAMSKQFTPDRPLEISQASGPPPPRNLWRKKAVIVGIALVLLIVGLVFRRPSPKFPAPVVVSITQSNAPLRVFPGTGVFLVLPDGSLWRWGQTGGPQSPRAAVPERVGTNSNWVEAFSVANHCVGLRKDGTLWEWGWTRGSNPGGPGLFSRDPERIDPGLDWVGVAAGGANSAALKSDGTLWAWGDNSVGQLGNGPGPNQSKLVQVGTDHDWAAVTCPWGTCTLGLRANGTLWAWGQAVSFGSGQRSVNNLPTPTQICRETNWIGFTTGFWVLARTRSGELWEPFYAPPNADGAAASTCRLILSNTLPDHVAVANCGELKLYEVHSDGTLFEKIYPMGAWATSPVVKWRQVGKRSDWVSIWGGAGPNAGTALGLTADGTIWTWGFDLSREPTLGFYAKLRVVQFRISILLGKDPRKIRTMGRSMGGESYLKEPRPLMRLVPSNSAQPIGAEK